MESLVNDSIFKLAFVHNAYKISLVCKTHRIRYLFTHTNNLVILFVINQDSAKLGHDFIYEKRPLWMSLVRNFKPAPPKVIGLMLQFAVIRNISVITPKVKTCQLIVQPLCCILLVLRLVWNTILLKEQFKSSFTLPSPEIFRNSKLMFP